MKKLLWVTLGTVALGGIGLALYWPYFAGTKSALDIEKPRDVPFLMPDPTPLQKMLDTVLDSQGRINYELALGTQRQDLRRYLKDVAAATPARFENDQQRLAFYINAYNALVIEGVLNHWPIDSIEDVGPLHKFFRQRLYTVAGTRISLHGFESLVIRKYNPLLHFALNCASESCPPLAARVYRAETLEEQMKAAAHAFINDPSRNSYDPASKTWKLSKIFEWYAEDFGGREGVLALLKEHAPGDWDESVTLTYQDYDWTLNSSRTGN